MKREIVTTLCAISIAASAAARPAGAEPVTLPRTEIRALESKANGTTPELFSRYLLVSPSLWYDDHAVLGFEERFAATRTALPARVYLAVGSREHNRHRNLVEDLEALAARMRGRSYRGLALEVEVFDDENHNSVFAGGFTRGVRYLFAAAVEAVAGQGQPPGCEGAAGSSP